MRRLDRSGDGEYRLNGARCPPRDVIEVFSDTGLGKETHSVISQGRVEAIVTSKPRDRRLLIEEAAGLGKHRKRRRRAQLKLERTQENLDRALDVEREARTRLRPLKRQAEAAELHERLEHQMLQARFELAREAVRARGVELVEPRKRAGGKGGARADRVASAARSWSGAGVRRARWPSAPSATTRSPSGYTRHARRASASDAGRAGGRDRRDVAQRASRIEIELGALGVKQWARERGEQSDLAQEQASVDRVRALETELAEIESERERELEREIEGLERRARASGRACDGTQAARTAREARGQADALAELGARLRRARS